MYVEQTKMAYKMNLEITGEYMMRTRMWCASFHILDVSCIFLWKDVFGSHGYVVKIEESNNTYSKQQQNNVCNVTNEPRLAAWYETPISLLIFRKQKRVLVKKIIYIASLSRISIEILSTILWFTKLWNIVKQYNMFMRL